MKPTIIAVCGDPGGANAVAPVIEALQAEGLVSVRALAYRQAQSLWTKRGLVFEMLAERSTRAMAMELLGQPGTALLLTGTSVNLIDLEKQFIAAANHIDVPSLAVLDFWTNYAWRFSDTDGRLVYVPDRIAVMDQRARDEMVADGFEPERLTITGQPAFDDLAVWHARFTLDRRWTFRESLGIGSQEQFVMFASQPLSFLYGTDPANPLYPGYDEHTVLRALISALDQIAEQSQQKIVLVIRPHPRESVEEFANLQGRAIRIIVSTEDESRDLVMAADLVIGMNTVLLVEACYLGCVTLSLQPGLRLPDVLPTNSWGMSRAVYHNEEIQPAIEQMLLDPNIRRATQVHLSTLQLDNGATQRVVKLIYQMAGLKSQ